MVALVGPPPPDIIGQLTPRQGHKEAVFGEAGQPVQTRAAVPVACQVGFGFRTHRTAEETANRARQAEAISTANRGGKRSDIYGSMPTRRPLSGAARKPGPTRRSALVAHQTDGRSRQVASDAAVGGGWRWAGSELHPASAPPVPPARAARATPRGRAGDIGLMPASQQPQSARPVFGGRPPSPQRHIAAARTIVSVKPSSRPASATVQRTRPQSARLASTTAARPSSARPASARQHSDSGSVAQQQRPQSAAPQLSIQPASGRSTRPKSALRQPGQPDRPARPSTAGSARTVTYRDNPEEEWWLMSRPERGGSQEAALAKPIPPTLHRAATKGASGGAQVPSRRSRASNASPAVRWFGHSQKKAAARGRPPPRHAIFAHAAWG